MDSDRKVVPAREFDSMSPISTTLALPRVRNRPSRESNCAADASGVSVTRTLRIDVRIASHRARRFFSEARETFRKRSLERLRQ